MKNRNLERLQHNEREARNQQLKDFMDSPFSLLLAVSLFVLATLNLCRGSP
jgi:hypothetical protein